MINQRQKQHGIFPHRTTAFDATRHILTPEVEKNVLDSIADSSRCLWDHLLGPKFLQKMLSDIGTRVEPPGHSTQPLVYALWCSVTYLFGWQTIRFQTNKLAEMNR